MNRKIHLKLFLYLKNIIQLILSPSKAWVEIENENTPPSTLLERGFYPLLAVMAITAFLHGAYGIGEFSVGHQLEIAISQFLAMFLGIMIARAALETGLPYVSSSGPQSDKSATLSIYGVSILVLIQIVANLCPISLTVLWFLPAFIIITIWHARKYLQIRKERYGMFVVGSFCSVVLIPLIIDFILNQIF